MKGIKKIGIFIMSLLITTTTLFACEINSPNTNQKPEDSNPEDLEPEEEETKLPLGISKFDDDYELNANWIWANTVPKEGQWVALRKTFNLEKVPSECIARISADTKYWLWINDELAVFEGQLKLGNSVSDWYYDKEDITKYLVEGENTIAVQVFYSGKTSGSTINTGVPGFLFDAKIGKKKIISDNSWKAVLDPAYQEPISLNNVRLGEANIKYDSSLTMVDENGNRWTESGYDDSNWANAINQDYAIQSNRIVDRLGVYYKDFDPRMNLVLRPIPQMKRDEVVTYTKDGVDGTKTWTKTDGDYNFAPLSLPNTYTLEAEVVVADPQHYTIDQPTGAVIGFCVCVSDNGNFYMPQISFNQADIFNGVRYNPHLKVNGGWDWAFMNPQDLTSTEVGKSLYLPGSYDRRYNTKHTVKIEVTPQTINTYLNDYLLGTINNTSLPREGSTIGLRQDINEMIKIYSLKVKDANGNSLYDAQIDSLNNGNSLSRISLLNAENANYVSPYNEVQKDEEGNSYVTIRNACVAINNGDFSSSYSQYKIVNRTNIQGTPYLKVKSLTGGELITIKPDTWVNGSASSIAHQYITTVGEQTWEALGWMNGYEITFHIPNSVEVLELGYRESGYDSAETGVVTTDNQVLNQLYREAYDTLYVCMRDVFMDCPDRERTQWWGDAVINMQQAAYAMDHNAALLYKKTLTQALGFTKPNGAIVSMVASPNDNLELPMQTLAGVHSFWQYYMYYGDEELLTDAYPVLINYLRLWNMSDSGVLTHRGGTWDWIDWGEHYDTEIIEYCWYYIALQTVLNIANLKNSNAPTVDIDYIKYRMNLMETNFDSLYWNNSKNAYYCWTDNGVADDRANAMAIYSGLADKSRYAGILNVLVSTYNASPYMEKYVLESMYLMGADKEAMVRTINRFGPFLEDGYPTLPEIWSDQSMFGGDETKNHAWTGAPLSLLYMYNAGILPTSAAFETIQVKPHLGTLTSVNAIVERACGKIQVNLEKNSGKYTMSVTIPSGASSAVIYVPRVLGSNTTIKLNGNTIYEINSALNNNMPNGVSYLEEDAYYIAFAVFAGSYTFISE